MEKISLISKPMPLPLDFKIGNLRNPEIINFHNSLLSALFLFLWVDLVFACAFSL